MLRQPWVRAFTAAVALQAAAIAHAVTPVDPLTTAVLAQSVPRFDAGGQDAAAIHRNLPQVIEQNIARLDAEAAERLVDGLSDREWHDLALVYGRAVVDSGRTPRLLALLAQRLDPTHLARLSRGFGIPAVQAAIVTQAPQKLPAFETRVARGDATTTSVGPSSWLYATPTEVYMDLRTMSYGAISANTALVETGTVIYLNAALGYGNGAQLASVFGGMIQLYAPWVWPVVEPKFDDWFKAITEAASITLQGQAEAIAGSGFLLDPTSTNGLSHGGDDDVTSAWEAWVNSSCGIKCTKTRPN